jgi:hypothetical protein
MPAVARRLLHLLLAAAVAAPGSAGAAVMTTTTGGSLEILLDGADDAVVTCAGGQIKVNGADPSPGPPAACAAVSTVAVEATGSFANTIDLRGVRENAGFTNLHKPTGNLLADLALYTITVDAGPGDDTVFASDDTQIGQRIRGGAGSDALVAGSGSTQLVFDPTAASEVDTLTANTGAGRFFLDFRTLATPVTVDLNGGVGGDPLAIASHANRVLKVGTLAQAARIGTLATGSGADSITSFASASAVTTLTIVGGAGNDTFVGGPRNESYLFGNGSGADTITDTAGDNFLGFCLVTTSVTVDLTGGLGGALIAQTGGGATVQLADAGDIATREQFFRIEGGLGNDLLIGNTRGNLFTDCGGDDEMHGGPGDDTFNETIFLAGSQYLTGNDRYEGGPGNDSYIFSCNGAPAAVTDTIVELPGEGARDHLVFNQVTACDGSVRLDADLRADAPIATVGPSGGPPRITVVTGAAGQAAHFEDVTASSAQGDVIVGNDANNTITAGAGDLVAGGPGDDTFNGGTVTYALAPGPVTVDLRIRKAFGEGTDTLNTSSVIGSPFDDLMIGAGSGTTLSGGDGSDTLISAGSDTLNGDAGDDLIYAGGGTIAFGGDGDDVFIANGFGGTLNGDAGDDTFILNGGLRTVNGGAGMDTIDSRNERADTIACGDDADVLHADELDAVADDCESVNPGPPPGIPDGTGLALLTCGTMPPTFAGVSADGTRVAFTTAEALLPADVDAAVDVYLRDGSDLFLVSGGVADVDASFDAISEDGSRVLFTTTEAIPGTGDDDAAADVYEWRDGARTLLTPGTAGDVFLGGLSQPDGARAFFTTAEGLVPADTDANQDVYERSGGTYTLVSAPAMVASPPGLTFFGLISADAERIYFWTDKALLPEDTDTVGDVYERSADGLRLISGPDLPGSFGFLALPVGATPSGSHVYFTTDKRLVADDNPGFLTFDFDLYVRSAGGLALVGGAGVNAGFVGASPDGARVVFTTASALVPADTDLTTDVYLEENGVLTLVSGGTLELPVRNVRASADASRVVFETDEPLLAADLDLTSDVYEYSGGALTLVTPGTANVPAILRGATADLATVFFRTAEALVPEDADGGIDIYARTAGGVTLVAAGTANVSTVFRGNSADGAVVVFDSSEALRPADGDQTSDLYARGPGGFPADPVCDAAAGEDCGNCVDDDQDLLVDRDDPDCPPRADGAGAGLDDPKRQGKPALACQKALGKAGAKHAAATLKRLQKCTGAVFTCVQKKPDDDTCLPKAGAGCAKLLAGRAGDRAKVAKAAGKACGSPKLAPADLLGAAGLGFAAEVAGCAPFGGGDLASVGDVATCLQGQHECRAEALLGQQLPRAAELLALAGRDPAVDAPCLAAGIDAGGDGVGDPKARGAALAKCQGALAKAAVKFLGQKQKLVQKCATAVAVCLQQKRDDPKCLPKARATCGKQIAAIARPGGGVEAKLAAAVAKACGAPRVALADLLAPAGLGFDARSDECAALGVAGLATLGDVATCVVRLHECRAEQLLDLQTPRLRELLDLGEVTLP